MAICFAIRELATGLLATHTLFTYNTQVYSLLSGLKKVQKPASYIDNIKTFAVLKNGIEIKDQKSTRTSRDQRNDAQVLLEND